MSAKRNRKDVQRPKGKRTSTELHESAPARGTATVRVRKRPGSDEWELVHPRCARDRQEDLEEVAKMIAVGEIEVAKDECRWLLGGCSDCIDAHRILGELALVEHDVPLARGHFGYAYHVVAKALDAAGCHGPLPYRLPANQAFFESAKGLAWCLKELGKVEMARDVIARMLQCDPSDPLHLKELLPAGTES